MFKFCFIILILFWSWFIAGQEYITPQAIVKSKHLLQQNVHDSVLIDEYHSIIKYYTIEDLNPDSIIFYGEQILKVFDEPTEQSEKLIQNTYKYVSVALWMQSEYEEAIALIEEKFERFPLIPMKDRTSDYMNIGLFHIEVGNYVNGIDYLFKAEKILNKNLQDFSEKEDISRTLSSLANVHINLGLAFENLGDHHRAIEFNEKSIEYLFKSGTENAEDLALAFTNLSVQYLALNKPHQAKSYIDLAIKEIDGVKDKRIIGFVKYNYASVFLNMDNFTEAEKLFLEAIEDLWESGSKNELGQCYRDLADLYVIKGKYKTALNYFLSAEEIFISSNSRRDLSKLFFSFSVYYEAVRNKSLAYDYLKKHIILNNEIVNDQIKQEGLQKDFDKQLEKQQFIDSLENVKKEAVNLEKIKRKDIELSAQRKQQLLLGVGLLVSAVLLFFIFIRYKQNLKQKQIIEYQHTALSKKNDEIIDSINYAKRLQDAILPRMEAFQKYFKQSFVFYLPKDIVAGDFYFYDVVKDGTKKHVFFAAADCTGHGVPGAMVSIVGANGLKRCIQEFGILQPAAILDRVAQLVADHFSQSKEKIRDGMDIALCCIEFENETPVKIQFAGANNPLWIINPNRQEPPIGSRRFKQGDGFEIKGDKQAIGYTEDLKPFTNHEFNLEKGDTFYTFSDGFADQFGGPNGKKFKSLSFKKLLSEINAEDMPEQKRIIKKTFNDWKNTQDQVDDVCVIGVRL